jgi:hypothetical protein
MRRAKKIKNTKEIIHLDKRTLNNYLEILDEETELRSIIKKEINRK